MGTFVNVARKAPAQNAGPNVDFGVLLRQKLVFKMADTM